MIFGMFGFYECEVCGKYRFCAKMYDFFVCEKWLMSQSGVIERLKLSHNFE